MNWSNNTVRQDSKRKLFRYIRQLEQEYERLMSTYEPTAKRIRKMSDSDKNMAR